MKKIPNCKICKWKNEDHMSIFFSNYIKCLAQGGNYCVDVYNNNSCKELFKAQGE